MMRKIAAVGIAALLSASRVVNLCGSIAAAEPEGAPIPATPPFASPDIKPTLCDWLTARPVALGKKIALSDPLQKPPFVGQPPDSLKGMAAGIRAVQLDAPNRVKAAAYLGTVDCVTYPQAQAMLIATMQEDPNEAVRYEAVLSLRMMLTRGCDNMESGCECERCRGMKRTYRETERHSKKMANAVIAEAKCHAKLAAIKARMARAKEARYDCCRGCCNPKALEALSNVAYGKDDQCCFLEPSARVREAAAEGLCLCRTEAGYAVPVDSVPPVTNPDGDSNEVMPGDDKETVPDESTPAVDKTTAIPPAPAPAVVVESRKVKTVPTKATTSRFTPTPITPAPVKSAGKAPATLPVSHVNDKQGPPVVPGLNGYCVVGLKARQFSQAQPQFSSVFEDRTYQFASAEAKALFDQDPTFYAPAYGGIDPVIWLDRHEMVEGKYLREFEGRFFLFAEKESWEAFKSLPHRFVLNSVAPSQEVVGR